MQKEAALAISHYPHCAPSSLRPYYRPISQYHLSLLDHGRHLWFRLRLNLQVHRTFDCSTMAHFMVADEQLSLRTLIGISFGFLGLVSTAAMNQLRILVIRSNRPIFM